MRNFTPVQGINGVRKERAVDVGVLGGRLSRSARSGSNRRNYSKAPRVEQAVADMGKKPKQSWPKQLSLRSAMANPSSTISFVQVRIYEFYI